MLMPYISSPTETQLDVSRDAVRRLRRLATKNYDAAHAAGHITSANYWNGYSDACTAILNMEYE
jgi:hypothetical protein